MEKIWSALTRNCKRFKKRLCVANSSKTQWALTEFKKVSDLTGKSLDNYISKLSELGKLTSKTTSQMIEASTQFKRAGFSEEDAANLSVYSTMLQNVSDGVLEVGESTDFIISQMKAFDLTANDAEHIISAVNEV